MSGRLANFLRDHQIPASTMWAKDFGCPWPPARCQMQDAEERRLRLIGHTPQGGASEGNAADDILTVDQGRPDHIDIG